MREVKEKRKLNAQSDDSDVGVGRKASQRKKKKQTFFGGDSSDDFVDGENNDADNASSDSDVSGFKVLLLPVGSGSRLTPA